MGDATLTATLFDPIKSDLSKLISKVDPQGNKPIFFCVNSILTPFLKLPILNCTVDFSLCIKMYFFELLMNGYELCYPKDYKNAIFTRSKVKIFVLLCFDF